MPSETPLTQRQLEKLQSAVKDGWMDGWTPSEKFICLP